MIKHSIALAFTLAAVSLPTASYAVTTVQSLDTNSSWTVTKQGGLPKPAVVPATVPSSYNGPDQNVGVNGAFWIYPEASDLAQNTNYAFTKVFNLVNFNTALLSGNFWSDNGLISIVLNGTTIFGPFTPTGSETTYQAGSGTALNYSGNKLQVGSNTLVFNVRNGPGEGSGNPVALMADLNVTSAVPEPGTWMLMLLGFAAIGFAMRSRAKTQVRFQFA